MNRKTLLPLGLALFLAAFALRSLATWEDGRLVDMVTVFAGAFGAGAALCAAFVRARPARG